MKQAIIKTGGKQYLVAEGSVVRVEKLNDEEGKKVTFKEVLLAKTDKTFKVGTPMVKSASVEAKVMKQARRPKVTGVKMKPKKRQRKLYGHKQPYTEVQITKIKTAA